jgi:hypothetical protein
MRSNGRALFQYDWNPFNKKTMQRHREKRGSFKLREKSQNDTNATCTLSPELRGNTFLRKLLHLWYCVLVALANQYTLTLASKSTPTNSEEIRVRVLHRKL